MDSERKDGTDPASAEPVEPPPEAVAAVPRPSRFWSRLPPLASAWAKKNWQDAVIVVALMLLAVLVLVIRADGISSGGDAIRKWFFVRQWFYKNDFSHAKWNHHMARFGVNAVSFITQCLVGRGPNAYFVPPIGAAVLQAAFIYGCGKRLRGVLAGVVGALILIFFKETPRASSQLLPEVFSGTYAIIGAYLYLRYTDAVGRQRLAWLITLSIATFWDYLAKETSIFFIPGFVLAIWMASDKFRPRARDIAIFSLIFFAGVALETGFYRVFTDYPHRFAMVVENHIPGDNALEAKTVWALLNRYDRLGPSWKFTFVFFVAASIGVAGTARTFRTSAIVTIIASYYFFLTFLVRGINPIVLWQAFRPRYLDPTIPFVALIIGLFLTEAGLGIWKRHCAGWLPRKLAPLCRFPAAVVGVLVVTLGWLTYADAKPSMDDNALRVNTQMAAVANDTYARNLPIVSTSPDKRGVWVVYAVLIDDHKLARKGFLPEFDDVKRTEGRRDYLVRNPSVYDGSKLSALMKEGCAVEVKTGAGGPVDMRPMKPLPARCDDLLAE